MTNKKNKTDSVDRWFWSWMFRGTKGRPGYRYVVEWPWTPIDIGIGIGLTLMSPLALQEAANVFLIPLAGIFVGLSFAWAGNAHSILQTEELEGLAEYFDGGLEGTVWEFQLAVLVVLVMLVAWGIAGLGLFDSFWPDGIVSLPYFATSVLLYGASSMGLRQCWNVVDHSQRLLVSRARMREAMRAAGKLKDPLTRLLEPDTEERPSPASGEEGHET